MARRHAMALLGTLGGGAARTAAVSLAGTVLFLLNRAGLQGVTPLTQHAVPTSAAMGVTVERPRLRSPAASTDEAAGPVRGSKVDRSSAVFDDVPECAQDVVVALHRQDAGDHPPCRGLLIRDDIVVTSKACAEMEYTFDFPGYGKVKAAPHPTLNPRLAREAPNSRLGFLEACPPYDYYHYLHVGKRVRRTRVFLGNGGDNTVAMSCDEDRPIAHGFPVNGELVPLGQLRNVVPDGILWERDLKTAPMLSYKLHKWWVKRMDLEDEQDALDELLKPFEGPPGSVSLPAVDDDYDGRMAGLLEAIDPRGHRHLDCFRKYFARYLDERPFSGTHFFDWLDFGNGKFLLERNAKEGRFRYTKTEARCRKREFNRYSIHYFTGEERAEREVYLSPSKDGKELIARYKHNDALVSESPKDTPHVYMFGLDAKLYVVDGTWDEAKFGEPKHSGLMAGRAALSAGEVYVGKGGTLWGINFNSGHYQPEVPAISLMYRWMKGQGFNTEAVRWVGLSVDEDTWSPESCADYDWRRVKVPGYDTTELRRACKEVMASPTFSLEKDIFVDEEDLFLW